MTCKLNYIKRRDRLNGRAIVKQFTEEFDGQECEVGAGTRWFRMLEKYGRLVCEGQLPLRAVFDIDDMRLLTHYISTMRVAKGFVTAGFEPSPMEIFAILFGLFSGNWSMCNTSCREFPRVETEGFVGNMSRGGAVQASSAKGSVGDDGESQRDVSRTATRLGVDSEGSRVCGDVSKRATRMGVDSERGHLGVTGVCGQRDVDEQRRQDEGVEWLYANFGRPSQSERSFHPYARQDQQVELEARRGGFRSAGDQISVQQDVEVNVQHASWTPPGAAMLYDAEGNPVRRRMVKMKVVREKRVTRVEEEKKD